MNFQKWLQVQEMRTPPHLPEKFYADILAELKPLEKEIKNQLNYFKNNISKTLDELYSITNVRAFKDFDFPRSFLDTFRYSYPPSERLETFLEFPEVKYLEKILPLPAMQDYLDWKYLYPRVFEVISDVLNDLENSKQDYEPVEYENIKFLVENFMALVENTQKWFGIINQLNKKVTAHLRDIKKEPATKDLETLFHATVAGTQILQNGFKTRKELGKSALGGGPDDRISFTADLNIAKAIAEALKDVIRIANEKMTFEDIVKRAESYDIDLTNSIQYATYQKTGKKKDLFNLYRLFLAYAQSKNILYDPWFAFVSIEDFEGLDINNVYVLACKVNIKDFKDEIEFLSSMQEFRVPVQAIQKCRKISY